MVLGEKELYKNRRGGERRGGDRKKTRRSCRFWKHQCPQMTAAMELLYLVAFLLLTRPGVTSKKKNGPVKLVVKEGSDTVLPCSLDQKDLTHQVFDWRKDGQEEVFLYNAGVHHNNGQGSEDPQLKDRVSHFDYALVDGNASIKISDTKVEDSGNYSCSFPNLHNQIFHIELVVERVLKKRNILGAAPEPSVTVNDHEANWVQLQCDVEGVFPEPRVEWKNSTGVLPSEMTLHSVVNNKHFDITLRTDVIQTGYYSCVVTQDEIHHQVFTKTFVLIGPFSKTDKSSSGLMTGVVIGAVVGILATLVVAGIVFVIRRKRSASVI